MRHLEVGDLRTSVIGLGGWQVGAPARGWGRNWGPAEAAPRRPVISNQVRYSADAAASDLTLAADEMAHLTTTADRFQPAPRPRAAIRRVRQRAGVGRSPDRHG
jgi:hypothetical protein